MGPINHSLQKVIKATGKKRIRTCDVFSGSGVVSRMLKGYSSLIVSNDFEKYAAISSKCFLANKCDVNLKELREIVDRLNHNVLASNLPTGFIEEMYAPKDEANITVSDRVFYTINNARRIDNFRRMIAAIPKEYHVFLLAVLLSEASIHANTAGVFKGFYKNKHTKIGQYGGSGSDALLRIRGDITLQVPVLSNYECDYEVYQMDANAFARVMPEVDLAYIDPPYNQHPYGSNYFMLNLIADYKKPEDVSNVSGIPKDWQRSGYNVRQKSYSLFKDLVHNINSRYFLISFNDEGFIHPDEMTQLLNKIGKVDVVEIQYNAFRGSRSFKNRSIHVTEHLFLVERK